MYPKFDQTGVRTHDLKAFQCSDSSNYFFQMNFLWLKVENFLMHIEIHLRFGLCVMFLANSIFQATFQLSYHLISSSRE